MPSRPSVSKPAPRRSPLRSAWRPPAASMPRSTRGAEAHLLGLTGKLIAGLHEIAGNRLRLIGPDDLVDRLALVSFAIEGTHPHDLCQILDRHGVALRGGHHCAQVLHDRFGIAGSARASLAAFNDDGDIDACLRALEDAMRILLP
ncbi:aminotransferase class V-fold PLP-dependent enzyme [Oleomonas cavernae]|uniref:aminotransferase class V-fold PLP-dependent enzyme n=1 Tax=Oleomonas cavernae TaxID=2320859 RepID=UPI0038D0A67A